MKRFSSKNTKTIKNTSYQEIDNAIWLYSQASGAKLRKMTDIPNNMNQKYRAEYVDNTIKFYYEKDSKKPN